MTRQQQAERQAAIDSLRKIIKPGDTVYTILDHVSRSGMSRNIRVVVPQSHENGSVSHWHPNHNVALAIDARRARNGDGITMGGCGMDMGFQLIYLLSEALYPKYKCVGKGRKHQGRCPSNYHTNYRREDRCSCLHWIENAPCRIEPYTFTATRAIGVIEQVDGLSICRTHKDGLSTGTLIVQGAETCKHTGDEAEIPAPDCSHCDGTGTITHAPESWRKLHRDGYALRHQWL